MEERPQSTSGSTNASSASSSCDSSAGGADTAPARQHAGLRIAFMAEKWGMKA